MESIEEVHKLTPYEYHLRMKAVALANLDNERSLHLQAYLTMAVQATEKRGRKERAKYPTFKKFFDYDEYHDEIMGIKKEEVKNVRRDNIRQLILIANKKGG